MVDQARITSWKSYFSDRVKKYGADYRACATYGSMFNLRCKAVTTFYQGVTGKRILDCGSGNGISTAFLASENFVVGLDNVYEMLPIARKNGLKPVTADIDHGLPFLPGVFDSALVISVMQYLENARNMCNEIFRALKPGGAILLYSQNLNSWLRSMLVFLQESNKEEFRHEFKDLKTLVESSGFNYSQTLLIRYPLQSIKKVVNPTIYQLGMATSFIVVGVKPS